MKRDGTHFLVRKRQRPFVGPRLQRELWYLISRWRRASQQHKCLVADRKIQRPFSRLLAERKKM
jgi:hypothetical protein